MGVLIEEGSDFGEGAFGAFWITGQVGADGCDESPNCPCASGAQFAAWSAESACLVLVTEARIAGKVIVGVVLYDPSNGVIWEGPGYEDGIGGSEVCVEGAGKCEQGAPSMTLAPEKMSVNEGVIVKGGISALVVTSQQVVI